MIHCNMLATFVLKCSTYIGFYGFVFNNSSLIWNQNHFMCILYNIFWNYSLLASFFWNMIEAVYLITVIVAAYSSNKIKLWWYLIIGWGNNNLTNTFPIQSQYLSYDSYQYSFAYDTNYTVLYFNLPIWQYVRLDLL